MTEPILTYRGTAWPWHCAQPGHVSLMGFVCKTVQATRRMFANARKSFQPLPHVPGRACVIRIPEPALR